VVVGAGDALVRGTRDGDVDLGSRGVRGVEVRRIAAARRSPESDSITIGAAGAERGEGWTGRRGNFAHRELCATTPAAAL
jgi:hypothetical protein